MNFKSLFIVIWFRFEISFLYVEMRSRDSGIYIIFYNVNATKHKCLSLTYAQICHAKCTSKLYNFHVLFYSVPAYFCLHRLTLFLYIHHKVF